MFAVQIKRSDGTAVRVDAPHTAHRISVQPDQTRHVQLTWTVPPQSDPAGEAVRALLAEVVPLMDTLILTRHGAYGEEVVCEAVVFDSTVELEGEMPVATLYAVDDPGQRTPRQAPAAAEAGTGPAYGAGGEDRVRHLSAAPSSPWPASATDPSAAPSGWTGS